MFEGLVRQLLLGYLGRYIKDFQKEQLKITLWNEEVLLENVELMLEAFDYLQLPLALKQGKVGRLSIKIPWKKLGWDPIIILLEDVFICAGQRDDHEWSADAVDRRDLAAKKAKLAAAELTKLSRRVCYNQGGQSFISHIAGKILDNIQVSIRNVHILYNEGQSHLMQTVFGLRFSSLTIMKHSAIWSSSWKARAGQVSKMVEICGLGFYCSTFQKSLDLASVDASGDSRTWLDVRLGADKNDYILAPFDASLLVVKSGKLDHDCPQYSVSAELVKLVFSIDSGQLRHMLAFSDYISTCLLREKYGRYRPWCSPLSRKLEGWQKLWWHYAQESVLQDVRKKLKKTSWRYLGWRLACRRKYVNIYKIKLHFLQQEQPVEENVLQELEKMEGDYEIDDILSFRSIAEKELEDSVLNYPSSYKVMEEIAVGGKSQNDEPSSGRARGLLNWLSQGVLGAGGTDDSSQFSGVVSEEIIKDICEATKFQPMPSVDVDDAAGDVTFLSAVKLSIGQISLSLRSSRLSQEIAQMSLIAVVIECKVWEGSATIIAKVDSADILDSFKHIAILRLQRVENHILESEQSSVDVQVDVSLKHQEADLLVKMMLQPLEINCNLDFILNLMEFYHVVKSFKLHQDRVLTSLNGIRDGKSRLLSKAEHVLSHHRKVTWDVNFLNISLRIPWTVKDAGQYSMVLEAESLCILSTSDTSPFSSDTKDQFFSVGNLVDSLDLGNMLNGLQLKNFYAHFEVSLNNFEIWLLMPHFPQGISVAEKLCASVTLAFCIIPEEMMLKQLEAQIVIPSLHVHFSPSIYNAILRMAENLHHLSSKSDQMLMTLDSCNVMPAGRAMPFCFSVTANLDSVKLEVNLEDDGHRSHVLILSLEEVGTRYIHTGFEDSSVYVSSLKVISYSKGAEHSDQILCLCRLQTTECHVQQKGISGEQSASFDSCFRLHYRSHRSGHLIRHLCVRFNDADFHCHPGVFRLLLGFCDKLAAFHNPDGNKKPSSTMESTCSEVHGFGFQRVGKSNLYENRFSGWGSIPSGHFPFATIYNTGSLRNLEGSIIRPIPEQTSFNLKDENIRMLESESLCAPLLKFSCEASEVPLVGCTSDSNLLLIELISASVKLHFHDSSCIVGTITIPVGKASVTSHEESLDVLCSIEGLTLFSHWWTSDFQKFLWRPSSQNQTSTLNLRMRKGNVCSSITSLELSISIQHVCCIIPAEYLAIIIGYFSLPDWNSNESDHQITQNTNGPTDDTHDDEAIVYKFEVLDSILMSPVESCKKLFLKLESQQLYCSFIQNDPSDNALKDILSECLVSAHKFADKIHALNVFGRDLHLSLLLFKDCCDSGSLMFYEAGHESFNLLQSLNVDVWIRIPSENGSSQMTFPSATCVMVRIASCEFVAEGCCSKSGFDALLDVINQYSLVEGHSKYFLHDVPQFIQLKSSLKDNLVMVDATSTMLTEIKCCANSLSVNLYQSRDSNNQAMVARIDAGFVLSAPLLKERVWGLDIHFSSLELYSLPKSVLLAKCCSDGSVSKVLDIHLSTIKRGEIKLLVLLPSLDIWLHLFDWTMVIDALTFYVQQFSQAVGVDVSNLTSLQVDVPESEANLQDSLHRQNMSTLRESEKLALNDVAITVRSECINLSCHIPIWVSKETFTESINSVTPGKIESHVSNIAAGAKLCKFVTIALHSRSSELFISGTHMKLTSNIEKTTGSMGISEGSVSHSWPFFRLFHLCAEFEVLDCKMASVHVRADIRCETFDIWLSHQLLYFWHDIDFENSKAESIEFIFGGLDLCMQLRKMSLLLTDGRWSCNGPLVELVMRNLFLEASIIENCVQGSVVGDLLINYNNIGKVMWEPFLETWNFQISMTRKHDTTALLNSAIMTDIHLQSTAPLNLNFTEPFIEMVFRTIKIMKDALDVMQMNDVSKTQRLQEYQRFENLCAIKSAPYVIHNMTSLSFVFHVYQGLIAGENFDVSASKHENIVPSGSSVPIYVGETLEEQVFNYRPTNSSDGLNKQLSNGMGHHFMTIQFEGTSEPSEPISMDLVGLTYFEVGFSKYNHQADANTGFRVPVVFDVSVELYSKLIRLYSTVILLNSASLPLELRFDIPFGISPKIVDPIFPGQEFPLPLHLAEAGRIRWRPLGGNYLWSEPHDLSNMLSQENKSGFLRSTACYPSHLSSDPYRCCLSIQYTSLPFSGRPTESLVRHVNGSVKQTAKNCDQLLSLNKLKSRFIHHVTLSTPLLVKNYLPQPVSLTIESGGVRRATLLAEVETSFFHIDSSHDLAMSLHVSGFQPSSITFPRAETFSSMARLNGTVLSLTETICFDAGLSDGLLYVTIEKAMDASSGSRELCISVPFLLYNGTGFSLMISRSDLGMRRNCCTVPSCYDSIEYEHCINQKDGLGLILSGKGSYSKMLRFSNQQYALLKSHVLSKESLHGFSPRQQPLDHHDFHVCKPSSSQSGLTLPDIVDNQPINVKPFMYSPDPSIPASEIMVRVSRCLPECAMENQWDSSWSNSFFLVAPSGSTTAFIPQRSSNSVSVISVTSSLLDSHFSGRTRAISFQPRYVISNACSMDLCYKQKGTNFVFHLGVGQHSHLHWPDITRELLVSVRFSEPGWIWSGSFSPDNLGDKQVKMRNYVSGTLNMIRVEVQNADVVIQDEKKIIGSTTANSGTNFILLSDDDTGFIPYRIDNFSKETLRIYQQKCETLETMVHPYTSCPYAWDEPCYPHQLVVELPGECIVGSYSLDDVKEYTPVHLPSSYEKRQRTLVSSIHAEGAIKVLSIVDTTCHVLRDVKDPNSGVFGVKRKQNEREQQFIEYKDKVSVTISFIGISLINSFPQELLFACAKDIKIDLCQSVEQQQFSFQILSLQIDNQLRSTPYPVIMSFDKDHRGNHVSHIRSKYDGVKGTNDSLMQFASGNSSEPVISFSAAKWRNKDMALISFEHIGLRLADFHLELNQDLLLMLLDFFKVVVSTLHSPDVPHVNSRPDSYLCKAGAVAVSAAYSPVDSETLQGNQYHDFSRIDNLPLKFNTSISYLPKIVPIGAPWQKIYLLARRQNKIYMQSFYLAPIKLTLSFSSNPRMLTNGTSTSRESFIHRGLMALADIEEAEIYLRQLSITNHIASWESIREILIKHYTKQFLHEMYKVFGSAGVIGNPMGFARRVGLGIKDFISVPAQGVLQSPSGLITGMAQGTTSLLSNTLYALSDAATQFSNVAYKGILAFTFDNQDGMEIEKQQIASSSRSKGVISELLEGLTGLLQSPIRGAEKHGLPGVLSGFALGVTRLVARPAASVLEVTGKTAQSIRNRSRLHRMASHRNRVRLPRPLRRELPLRPYSWEEAVGTAMLIEIDDGLRFKDEELILCKSMKDSGKFVVLTERLILIVNCPSLVELGKPEFQGISADPLWIIEVEIGLENVIHADADEGLVHIVSSGSETPLQQNQHKQRRAARGRTKQWNEYEPPASLPLFQSNLELETKEEADYFLQILLSTIEQGKERGWGNVFLLHQSNLSGW
ncbi:hypothetical protein Nepgr_001020 [Nepenthes gracilis]|uniref:Vacuolar protein sorting-associated protein 13A n=1 Tax=Nepenthes gracilis TaxID=150966 RepID=A0AAD3RX12_NEPGR|nr:hypothetical protein Nepgr_001020 [Nepenthes gracilis]